MTRELYSKEIDGEWAEYWRTNKGGKYFSWAIRRDELIERHTARISKELTRNPLPPLLLDNPDYDPEDPESPMQVEESAADLLARRKAHKDEMISAAIDGIAGDEREGNHYPDHDKLVREGWKSYLAPGYDPATQDLGGYKYTDDGNNVTKEVADLTAEEIATLGDNKWVQEMSILDRGVTARTVEDIYLFVTGDIAEIPQHTKDVMTARVNKRAER